MTQAKCPICSKPSVEENQPFCSARCQLIDLNRWMSGAYVIPSEEPVEEDKIEKNEESH